MSTPFVGFKKIPRYSRDIIITEKIDGTNAQILIEPSEPDKAGSPYSIAGVPYNNWSYCIYAGSRSRWITPKEDNHGFAKWVEEHAEELVNGLGPGTHFGEWWGSGIQRGYGLEKGEKRFSLFNTGRWCDVHSTPAAAVDSDKITAAPSCCYVVPTLYVGPHSTDAVEDVIEKLAANGSVASTGFSRPEGIIIYHSAANMYFKKTIEKDEKHKYEV